MSKRPRSPDNCGVGLGQAAADVSTIEFLKSSLRKKAKTLKRLSLSPTKRSPLLAKSNNHATAPSAQPLDRLLHVAAVEGNLSVFLSIDEDGSGSLLLNTP